MFSVISSTFQNAWRTMAAVPSMGQFTPTADDVHTVRVLFVRGLGLPTELADIIIDAAEYYPVLHKARVERSNGSINVAANWSQKSTAAFLYLITDPIPAAREGELVRIKAVKFHTKSRDQGWADQRSSYASIFRPVPGVPDELDSAQNRRLCMQRFFYEPEDAAPHLQAAGWNFVEHDGRHLWKIQNNVVAGQYFKPHEVEWRVNEDSEERDGRGDGKGFIGALEPGDRVGIWARALYPGWANVVKEASVEIRYSV